MRPSALAACVAIALALVGVSASAAGDGVPSFAASRGYAVPNAADCGRCSLALAVADLNGDGRADVVVANEDETVSVFLATGGGSLGARRDYVAGGSPAGVAVTDLNHDGHPDLAVADADGFVTTFFNNGDGTFGTRSDYAAGDGGSSPVSIAAADLDGNGTSDLVTANSAEYSGGAPSISVFLNLGDGTFAPNHDYPVPEGEPVSVALGDLNGDGKPEVVIGDKSERLSVLPNRGDGTFAAPQDYAVDGAVSVAVGDLNGDGKADVAAATGAGVSVLLNAGDGTMGGTRSYPVLPDQYGESAEAQSIALGDLNGDHRPDVATANFDKRASLLLNAGTGTFGRTFDLRASKCGYVDDHDRAVAIGDVNGDGRADVAVAGDNGLCISLAEPGRCNVQDAVGLTVAGARARIARAHCSVGRVAYAFSPYTKRGRVTAQKPGFGGVLPAGGKVELVVSRGPKR